MYMAYQYSFITAYDELGNDVINLQKIRKKYMKTNFWPDIISIFSLAMQVFLIR